MPPNDPLAPANPAPPLTRHGQLEVDAFCPRCHYNLHGQDVWLDERLNFPICRCPECGQHYPAGSGVTAHSVWLRRFASMLLALWVVLVLAVIFIASLAFFGMQSANINQFTYWAPNNSKAQQYIPKHTLQPPPDSNVQDLSDYGTLAFICLISTLLGFVVGGVLVSVLWHWPRRRYALVMVLPFISACFTLLAFYEDASYADIFTWCISRILFQAAFQALGIFLGIKLGRKLARLIVRMIIPQKPRQLLAFLWRADGKPMPEN